MRNWSSICHYYLGAAYARRSEMVLHTRIAHTGERPFQCAFCPKNFQRRDLMRKHERIHTDTRPYACQYCAKGNISLLINHRTHTAANCCPKITCCYIPNFANFYGNTCNYWWKGEMRMHRSWYKNYICMIYGKHLFEVRW